MRLTARHLDFYREKKTPNPSWVAKIAGPKLKYLKAFQPLPTVSIDELVNSQVPTTSGQRRLEASNLCNLIRAQRDRIARYPESYRAIDDYWTIESYLYHLAFTPYSTDSKRRTAYAKKWYRLLIQRRATS